MSCERSLVVRGIPADWTEDNVELLLDSDDHCPNGCVEKVELAVGKGTATVTFQDARGNYSVVHHF